MIEQLPSASPAILGFKLQGKLHDRDYQTFVPTLEAAIAAHGKIRLLAWFEDFHGWDLHAMWDDFQFGVKHYSDLERIAIVGDRKWEEWMAKLCKPFTKASVHYFDISQTDAAWAWLREGA
ncbi:MAG: STAS/SEC14 domain-containing protein [Candidatus Competibacteraceae bacterium]|nr:STAS/SEC14 domain-containing protein [Candidatus Competibacteraceae bacterium]